MISSAAAHILSLPGWLGLLLVFAIPALEASAFVGFVFPGEIALVLGGVLAYEHRLPLALVLVAGIAGAVAGDSVGYLVGRRYGRRLLDASLGRLVRAKHLDRGERYLAERGGKAVFVGRFTAALRVVVPGLAGMARMRYRTFLVYNVVGGTSWAATSVLLGYFSGAGWQHASHVASEIGLLAAGVLALAVAGAALLRTNRVRRVGGRIVGNAGVGSAMRRFPRTWAWIRRWLEPESPRPAERTPQSTSPRRP